MGNVNMKTIYLVLILITLVLLYGCAYGSKFSNRPAYIKFSGNTEGVILLIDDMNQGLLEENSKENYIYKYTPGIHQITLLRNEVVILKTTTELKKGKTIKLNLP